MDENTSETENDTENQLNDDYYAFLNVSHEATREDINNSYRRLSKLYHPDKHSDPVRKKQADLLFNKTKTAYEVLSDPHKRAIYDTVGIKGLETDGWEVVQRTKTPQEIRDEYERLSRENEERRLQQRTNPKGTVSVSINATDLFETYDEYDSHHVPQLEVSGMSIAQSIETPLTTNDTLSLSGNLTTQNGNGFGNVSCSLRRILSPKTWTELELGAGNGLLLNMKGFHTINQRSFMNLSGLLQFTPHGLRPGVQAVIARQLDKHTIGYLTWKAGHQSSMSTMIVWDTNSGHLAASLQLGIPHSYFSFSYTHKFSENEGKIKGGIKAGTFGLMVECGCEKKISANSTLGASMSVGVPAGVTLKIKINRASQNYVFPILLSEELLPTSILYGSVAPLLGWYALNILIIKPYVKKQRLKEVERNRELNSSKIAQKRAEAEAAVALMQETVSRIREQEQAKQGIVIVKALYGKLVQEQTSTDFSNDSEVIDVTIPLQCLVRESKLVLQISTKCNLPGFYDPCYDEEKSLYVQYQFHNMLHEVTIQDNEPLKIPHRSHMVNS